MLKSLREKITPEKALQNRKEGGCPPNFHAFLFSARGAPPPEIGSSVLGRGGAGTFYTNSYLCPGSLDQMILYIQGGPGLPEKCTNFFKKMAVFQNRKKCFNHGNFNRDKNRWGDKTILLFSESLTVCTGGT
jgi:hypothetical protein